MHPFCSRRQDRRQGVRTISLLALPVVNGDNEIVGVLQVANKLQLATTSGAAAGEGEGGTSDFVVASFSAQDEEVHPLSLVHHIPLDLLFQAAPDFLVSSFPESLRILVPRYSRRCRWRAWWQSNWGALWTACAAQRTPGAARSCCLGNYDSSLLLLKGTPTVGFCDHSV